jgi:hypothetical protein
MGFPSVLERIAKALGLYPKNDPNNRNISQGIGQQPGRNEGGPIQDGNVFPQGYARNVNSPVNAGPDAWRQPFGTAQQGFSSYGNVDGQPQTQQTDYRPDNIVRMPDRDGGRDYYARDTFSGGAYQQGAYSRDTAGYDAGGRDAYGRDASGRDFGRDAYGRDGYGHNNDPFGRDPYAQSAQQMAYSPSTIIFCVRRKEDSSEIINYLLAGLNVILTFEDVDDVQCQRVLDFVGGAAFALEGSVEKISYRNYFVAPRGAAVVRSESQMRNPLREASSGYYSSRY